jgi:hypothetical protein
MPARKAITVAAAVLTSCVALSALAGCYVDVGALQHRTHRYSVSGQVQILVVNAHVGSVHVTGISSGRSRSPSTSAFGTRSRSPRTAPPQAPSRWSATARPWRPAVSDTTIRVPRPMTVRVKHRRDTAGVPCWAGHGAHQRRQY